MGKYLTYEHLGNAENNFEHRNLLNELHRYASYSRKITIFLSHRHSEDIQLINQVRGFFASMGASVYIDWMDSDMPAITNAETAEKLKRKIVASQKFIVLATPQSIESIWIPWEIGLADQIKGLQNIAILPIIHENGTWEKREYYQLYNRIEQIEGHWTVLDPKHSYYGTALTEWLRN